MSQIVLSPTLDLTAASALKLDLQAAFAGSGSVTIDAGQVRAVGSPCLQILVAAVMGGASLTNGSAAFCETASLLGLASLLKLEDTHDQNHSHCR